VKKAEIVTEDSIQDEEKFAELIVYVAHKIGADPTGGATKINKILFSSEFASVRLRGKPISGVEYQKLRNGPAPRRLLPIRDRLIAEGAVVPRQDSYFGRALHRLDPQRPAKEALFDDEELKIVDQVIDALWGKSATEVSQLSHDEKGWQMVDEGETIPYSAAFLSTTFRSSEAVKQHAAELSKRLVQTSK
jgi:hypothetical protein